MDPSAGIRFLKKIVIRQHSSWFLSIEIRLLREGYHKPMQSSRDCFMQKQGAFYPYIPGFCVNN